MMEDLFKERKEKLNLFKALLPKTKEALKPAQNNVPEGLYTPKMSGLSAGYAQSTDEG